MQASIFPSPCHGINSVSLIHPMVDIDTIKEICGPNSSHKTDSIRECCPLLINMRKVLSTSIMRLFLNTVKGQSQLKESMQGTRAETREQRYNNLQLKV